MLSVASYNFLRWHKNARVVTIDTTNTNFQITKEQLENEYKKVLKELKKGTSIAKTAKLCDTSPATVARLKKKFGL